MLFGVTIIERKALVRNDTSLQDPSHVLMQMILLMILDHISKLAPFDSTSLIFEETRHVLV